MKQRLSHLEAQVEALVEGTFARLLGGKLQARDVAVQLARALEDSVVSGVPATRYAVRLHPADAQALLGDQPRLGEKLAAELIHLARESNLTLTAPPDVLILPDAALRPRTVTVTTEARTDGELATQGMTPVAASAPAAPRNAFLILEGTHTFPLTQPVVGLGRRLDNHIIFDDLRISRAHAQIRLRFGRYVLYDLGSTGGTFVNGQRVQECVLRPGDVISLAGVALIYGEDEAPTGPLPPYEGAPHPQANASTQLPEAPPTDTP